MRHKASTLILLSFAVLGLAASLPLGGRPSPGHTLIWNSKMNQFQDACQPVRVVPLWMCVSPELWRVVSWDEALTLLFSGHVEGGAQLHNLTVLLVLNDGTIARTQESAIDQIYREVEKCGGPCKGVGFATE